MSGDIPDKPLVNIAPEFKKARLKLGMTQSEVADKAGIARGTYANIECARKDSTLNTIIRIGIVLGLKLVLRPKKWK